MTRQAHILIAEDNAALGNVLKFNLQRAGFRVTLVSEGRSALEHLEAAPFDLLVTDQQMPLVDGSEICRRMRSMPHHASTPVILVTAKGLELNLETLRAELGVAAIFPKPFSPAAVLQKVEECLSACS